MTGSIVSVSGYFALGRAGLTGLARDPGSYAVAPGGAPGRVLDGAGSTLQALNNSRNGIDQIKSALTKLRDSLKAAREQANAVPGRTEQQAVVADVEQTVDKPTYVMVDGQLVQTGTITVSLGTRPLVVGYERANRASLDVSESLKSLASTVATLVSSVGTDGTGGFTDEVSALLRNDDLITAVNTPDAGAIDAATLLIDGALAKADGLGFSIGTRATVAAQVDLSGALLNAIPNSVASTGPAVHSGDSPYRSNSISSTGVPKSSWV